MVLYFSQNFVHVIIVGALIATAIAATALIVMFIRDAKNNEIW